MDVPTTGPITNWGAVARGWTGNVARGQIAYPAQSGTSGQGMFRNLPPGGAYGGYAPPAQYPFGAPYSGPSQLPRFGGPSIGSPGWRKLNQQQPQQDQQSQYPFQFPNFSLDSLGNFYQPHGMGDAQNVPNQGQMANFIGNQWQNSQWGQTPGNQNQYMPPTQGYQSLPGGGMPSGYGSRSGMVTYDGGRTYSATPGATRVG